MNFRSRTHQDPQNILPRSLKIWFDIFWFLLIFLDIIRFYLDFFFLFPIRTLHFISHSTLHLPLSLTLSQPFPTLSLSPPFSFLQTFKHGSSESSPFLITFMLVWRSKGDSKVLSSDYKIPIIKISSYNLLESWRYNIMFKSYFWFLVVLDDWSFS